MKLRSAGVCRECANELPAGTKAVYEISSKTVRCLQCADLKGPQAQAPTAETLAKVTLQHLDGEADASGLGGRPGVDAKSAARSSRSCGRCLR